MTQDPMVVPTAVKWKRHPSARALVLAHFRGMGIKRLEDAGLEGRDTAGNVHREDGHALVSYVRQLGMWAFVDVTPKVPVVHYWAKRSQPILPLAFMLGHELGHISGKPYRSDRKAWAEELRANEYGAVTMAVLTELARGRRLRPGPGRARR